MFNSSTKEKKSNFEVIVEFSSNKVPVKKKKNHLSVPKVFYNFFNKKINGIFTVLEDLAECTRCQWKIFPFNPECFNTV